MTNHFGLSIILLQPTKTTTTDRQTNKLQNINWIYLVFIIFVDKKLGKYIDSWKNYKGVYVEKLLML